MSIIRRQFVDDRYERRVDIDKIPPGRQCFLGVDDPDDYPTGLQCFIGDYKWQPVAGQGIRKGAMGEVLEFEKATSAGPEFMLTIEDWDYDVYNQLCAWFGERKRLRLFAPGEEWISGRLTVPSYREWPEKLELPFTPFVGYRYVESPAPTAAQLQGAFRMGRTRVFNPGGGGGATPFNVYDPDFDEYFKVGDAVLVDRAGTIHSRTIAAMVPGATITLNLAVAGLSAEDPIYSPGHHFGERRV